MPTFLPASTPIIGLQSDGLQTSSRVVLGQDRMQKLRYIHLGDSIVLGDSDARNNFWASRDLCWNTALASGGILLAARNAGVGGQTSPQVAQRVLRDVLTLKPDVVLVTVGINDVGVLASDAYITDALQEIHNACTAAGVWWCPTTTPPNNSYSPTLMRSINEKIQAFAAANDLPCPDLFNTYRSPNVNGGVGWIPNYSNADGIHPTSRTSQRMGQYIWSVVGPYIAQRVSAYNLRSISVQNILFPATANTGLPSSGTTADPLFINFRSFTQNGFTLPVPYLFATQFGGGTSPTVSATVAAVSGMAGNGWTITAQSAGGVAGSYSFQTTTANRPIDVTRFQGRRLRVEFMFAASGFSVENTDAYLSANSSAPISSCGLSFACLNTAGTAIANTNVADPIDASSSLGQASSIPLEYQATIFAGPSAASNRWSMDQDLTPVAIELNIPVGAVQLQITGNISFQTGSVAPVSMTLGQFSFRDVGPSFVPQLPVATAADRGYLTVTSATTLTAPQVYAAPFVRCDATSAAFALTLPAASTCLGRVLTVKKLDVSANAITITRAGSDTIDGATTLAVSTQYQTVRLYGVLGGWDVI